ncbi:MAG: hypothetical protein JNL57_11090 [Bacteroidetes bacterium]|nr:hypothetical protein [Bacteroidota bacterium]
MKKLYYLAFLTGVIFVIQSCQSDKYRSNRFAGIYEITGYTSQLWDSTGMVSSTEIPCNYTFYLSSNGNEFGNASGKLDTAGTEPSFLGPLKLSDYSGLDRFTFNWNLGTSDNYRLSLLKADGLITKSVIVNIKRNLLGKVNAFTYVRLNGDGTYYFDEFKIQSGN